MVLGTAKKHEWNVEQAKLLVDDEFAIPVFCCSSSLSVQFGMFSKSVLKCTTFLLLPTA